MSSAYCHAADIVFIRGLNGSPTEQRELQIATDFYGLNLKVITPSADNENFGLRRAVERPATLAVAVEANALALVKQQALLLAMNRSPGHSIPLLILGVTPETDAALLRTWSGGGVTGSTFLKGPGHPRYIIGRFEGFTRQLADLEFQFSGNDAAYFVLAKNHRAQQIENVRDDHQIFPVFIEISLQQQKVFLVCKAASSGETEADSNIGNLVNAFAEIAPAMMFIRYYAGERGWHSIHHYANLTIDDPWLREPYGSLDYRRLLGEMDRHNFHSTIAFIPWNYDRSEPKVASLIREHPDRFSISVHGDNHDHKEFTDYASKPLAFQEDAIKQSLARMDKFQKLTGIPYDRVMVFPHSVAPEKTFEALKTYNYLATINSSNVPMGLRTPPPLPFALRPVTVAFSNFASITRYAAEVPPQKNAIALNDFLENPIVFYCHQDFFAGGIDTFDVVADQLNQLEPETRWRSLGDIVRHLYLVKLRDDRDFDVLTYSSNVEVENSSGRDSIFYIRKQENGRLALRSVRVDGEYYPYQLHDGYLELRIPIPADKARSVAINYKNDLEVASISTSKNSVRVYVLRMASDVRDIVVSRYAVGRTFIQLYNQRGTTNGMLVYASVLMMCFGCGGWLLRRTIRRFGRVNRAARQT